MSKPDVVAVILLAGATLYATFGGADFGAGVWELLSVRSRDRDLRGRVERRVASSLGPVWEANHVWLIFTLVVLWTGFPDAFAAIMETLYLPLALAAVGIVLRGSGFAFGHTFGDAAARRAHVVFAVSSLITPFFLGCVVGAIAAGDVEAGGSGSALGWVGPLPILVGVLFVASCAYIAAVFLLDDCRRAGDEELEPYFLRRSIAAAVVTGILAAAGLVVLHADARPIFDGLLDEGLPFVIASALLGLLTLAGLVRGWSRALRPLAIGAVVAVVAGWAVAQYPYLLPETLTVERRRRRRAGPDRADRRLHRRPRGRRPVAGAAVPPRAAAGARVAARPDRRFPRPGTLDAMSSTEATDAEEEYLQSLFWLQEAELPMTGANVARAMQLSPPTVHEMIGRLVEDGYIAREPDKSLRFTEDGREHAEAIVTRHRLIERFLTDVLGIPWDEVHEEAERMEHAMSPRMEERMMAAIGDAKTCPHGHPIILEDRIRGSLLADCVVGAKVRILRFENEAEELLHYLRDAGFEPGMEATVKSSDDEEVVITSADGDHVVSHSVAETVSVVADPAPPPRAALPEQLQLSRDKYGR